MVDLIPDIKEYSKGNLNLFSSLRIYFFEAVYLLYPERFPFFYFLVALPFLVFLYDFIRFISDLLPIEPSLLPFLLLIHFQYLELTRTYKREARPVMQSVQLPNVGTLLSKKGGDSEGAEVGLKAFVKCQNINDETEFRSSGLHSRFWTGNEVFLPRASGRFNGMNRRNRGWCPRPLQGSSLPAVELFLRNEAGKC